MRPAIDPLFRSAAAAYGPRTIGIVLSGSRDDGASGAQAITETGGAVVVQDPAEAGFPGMPAAAIAIDHPDHVVGAAEIAPLVAGILDQSLRGGEQVAEGREDDVSVEARYAALEADAVGRDGSPGELTAISCPEYGGTLWELLDGKLPRFRCRVGHAYTLETALEDQERSLDRALWIALRARCWSVRRSPTGSRSERKERAAPLGSRSSSAKLAPTRK
jgi:two-component system chemotaxis response regulator CheB